MRILVCGGRDYGLTDTIAASDKVRRELMKAMYLLTKKGLPVLVTVIHGNATGADTLAGLAAKWLGWDCAVYPADWQKYGKRAGYIRNKQMLDEGKPDLVLAFPGGKGTAMMVKLAREAGVEVIEIER